MPHPSPVTATLDRDSVFSGRVSGQDLAVMGVFDGELHLTGRLHTAAGSRLHARVQADHVDLQGEFEGEIRAGTLLVAATARARGVFVADRVCVQEGAVLDGAVQSPPAPAATAAAEPPAGVVAPPPGAQKSLEAATPA